MHRHKKKLPRSYKNLAGLSQFFIEQLNNKNPHYKHSLHHMSWAAETGSDSAMEQNNLDNR
jgi:hypothetical protein